MIFAVKEDEVIEVILDALNVPRAPMISGFILSTNFPSIGLN